MDTGSEEEGSLMAYGEYGLCHNCFRDDERETERVSQEDAVQELDFTAA